MEGPKFRFIGTDAHKIREWIWRQWGVVERPSGSVEHYTWMGRKSKICRGEALDWLGNSFTIAGTPGASRYLQTGDCVNYQEVKKYLKEKDYCHQVDVRSIQRAALSVLEMSGFFENVTEVQTSETVD